MSRQQLRTFDPRAFALAAQQHGWRPREKKGEAVAQWTVSTSVGDAVVTQHVNGRPQVQGFPHQTEEGARRWRVAIAEVGRLLEAAERQLGIEPPRHSQHSGGRSHGTQQPRRSQHPAPRGGDRHQRDRREGRPYYRTR